MSTNGIITPRPSAYSMIDPKSVTRKPGHNPRFEFGEITDLARSIKYQADHCKVTGGLLQAIIVKRVGDGFELVDGDRRLTAIEMLLKMAEEGKPEGYTFPDGIPARMVDKAQDDVTSLIQMFEANTGKAFLPLEEAAAYKKMRDAGMTVEEIGKAVQRAHMHIVSTLAILEGDESLKDAVKAGTIKGTLAKEIAVVARKDLKKQAELVNDAIAAGKDAKKKAALKAKIAATRVAKNAAKGKTLKIRALTDAQLSEIGDKTAKHLAVLLKDAKKMGDGSDLAEIIKKDDQLAVAFTFGVLQALKAAAGLKIELFL